MGSYVELLKACKEGNHRKVKKLLENCIDIGDVRDLTDKTLLHYCFKYEPCTELILAAAPELLDVGEKNGYTVLHLASMIKPPTSLQYLLSKKPDINKRNNDSRSSLLLAVIYDNFEAVKLLCENHAEVNITDISGVSPLHYAAKVKADPNCEEETLIIDILLKYGANIDGLDFFERSPLMWAVCSNNIVKMKYLIERGANIYSKDTGGLSILHYATSNGNIEIIKLLLEYYKFDLETLDSNNCTALMYACSYNNLDVIEFLLENGSNVNAEDCKRRNAAHFASGKGDLKNLEILHKFNVDLWKLNNDSNYPLHEAAYKGHAEIVEFLVKHLDSKDKFLNFINHKNSNGQTSLHLSTVKDNLAICKILLENGADPNIPLRVSNGKSMTALDLANQDETKHLIIKYNGKTSDDLLKTSVINEEGTGSISEESSEIEESETNSTQSSSEIDKTTSENSYKNESDNENEIIDKKNNGETNSGSQKVDNKKVNTRSVEKDIEINNSDSQDIDIELEKTMESSELDLKSENNIIKSTKINMESENINIKLQESNLKSTYNIIESTETITFPKKRVIEMTEDDMNYLLLSCYNGTAKDVSAFIEKGGQISEVMDKSGKTLLHYSLKNKDAFELIIREAPELVNRFDDSNHTILHMVIMSKEIERLPLLLTNNTDFNFPDNNGRTALHLAVSYNNLEALKCMNYYVKDKSQFLHMPDKAGNYPLHYPLHYTVETFKTNKSVCQCREFLELLLKMNGDIECRDSINRTPLLLAININHTEAVVTLLQKGANIMARDNQSLCSVHYACSEGNLEIFNELAVLEKFDPNIKDPNGLTPIFYAVSNCCGDIVKRLIELNAKIDVVDQYGRNLCHKAAEKGAFKCLELLLSYNVDPWCKAEDGTMPLHEAAYRGYKEIAEILLNTNSAAENINVKNNSGQTALHLAAVRNDCPMCFLLISKGSNINELLHNNNDHEDLTAYDLATTPYCKQTLKAFGGRSAKRIIDYISSVTDYDNLEDITILKNIDYDIKPQVSVRSTELALSTIPSVVYTVRTNEVSNGQNSTFTQPLQSSRPSSKKSENSSKKKISVSSSEKSSINILSSSEIKEEAYISIKKDSSSIINRVDTERDLKNHQEKVSGRKTNLAVSSDSSELRKSQTARTNSSSASGLKKHSSQLKSASSSKKKQKDPPSKDKIMQSKIQNSVIHYEYIRLNCKIANDIARLKIREENIEKLINPKITKIHKNSKSLKPKFVTV